MCRLGDPADTAAESGWSNGAYGSSRGDDVLAAALEETEARASALDLENARLRLALVLHHTSLHADHLSHYILSTSPTSRMLHQANRKSADPHCNLCDAFPAQRTAVERIGL